MSYISEQLEAYTASNSNFDTSRPYISISHCIDPVEKMVETFSMGFEDTLKIRLRCYKGYQIERDMISRLRACFPEKIELDAEIKAFNDLVQGHPDFLFDGLPGDIKSIPLDEHFPFSAPNKRIPARVYWQMQGYMLYMRKEKALVVYESRESGFIRDFWISSNPAIQRKIDDKFKEAVNAILAMHG